VRIRSGIRWALPGICDGLFVLPAVALAGKTPTGGATAPTGTTGATGPTAALPGAGTLTLSPSTVTVGDVTSASGALPSTGAGAAVALQVLAKRGWRTVARGVAGAGGTYVLSWRARRAGQLLLRVVSGGATAADAPADAVVATPEAALSVYRHVIATWYGPGFYGRHTACGEIMSRTIVGVADRTLPCGTPVSVTYNGETLVIPVIDRGPYSGAATLDLTHAAAVELGITETVPVGMLALHGPALAPVNWSPPGAAPKSGATGSTGVAGPTSTAGGATAPAP
jgi:rare lipoprotein A